MININIINKHNILTKVKAPLGANLLDVIKGKGYNIDGTCNSNLECTTCHCIIDSDNLNKKLIRKSIRETDLLSTTTHLHKNSRLSCKINVIKEMENTDIYFPTMSKNTLEVINKEIQKKEKKIKKIIPKKFKNYTKSHIKDIFKRHCPEKKLDLDKYKAITSIIPFRTNNYVVEELIDWNNIPNDPIFNLVFPQTDMLDSIEGIDDFYDFYKDPNKDMITLRKEASKIHEKLNPHPAGQLDMNIPNNTDFYLENKGIQHKYRETMLFFPSESQYCHSYCTYCFRWAQFVGSSKDLINSNSLNYLLKYLKENKKISDILFTGGDPMVMNSKQLGRYLNALSSNPELEHLNTIRIGSKSLSYWPYKYVTDDDAKDMLKLLENTVNSGKHVSLMAHFSHPNELKTDVVKEAIRLIKNTGVQIRTQAPIINHINNDPKIWEEMWRLQINLGLIPYYMFIERDTGAKNWFGVPLFETLKIYQTAQRNLSGLAKTVRGPSMSCNPGKIQLVGVETINNEKVFALKFLQARNPHWNDKLFFAKYDETAKWIDDLKPAFGEKKFFYEDELEVIKKLNKEHLGTSGQLFQNDIKTAYSLVDNKVNYQYEILPDGLSMFPNRVIYDSIN